MNIIKSVFFPRKIVIYLRKYFYCREFKVFFRSSGIGNKGYGDGCIVAGKDRISIGRNTYFGDGSELIVLSKHFERELNSELTIGDNVRCTGGCRITCAGNIHIGNNVLIAPEVFITDHNHGMNPLDEMGYSPQPLCIEDVFIADGVWLGQRCCVLPGVKIGKHSIIGANSTVTHNIPDYSIAAGSPARVLKKWNFTKREWEEYNNG